MGEINISVNELSFCVTKIRIKSGKSKFLFDHLVFSFSLFVEFALFVLTPVFRTTTPVVILLNIFRVIVEILAVFSTLGFSFFLVQFRIAHITLF